MQSMNEMLVGAVDRRETDFLSTATWPVAGRARSDEPHDF